MKCCIVYDCPRALQSNGTASPAVLKMLQSFGAPIVVCFSSEIDTRRYSRFGSSRIFTLKALAWQYSSLEVCAVIAETVTKGNELLGALMQKSVVPIYSASTGQWQTIFEPRQQPPAPALPALEAETFHNGAMPSVGLVLGTYENEDKTMKFFKSFFDFNSEHFKVTIYWIDNGSSQESVNKVNNYLKKKKADNVKIEKIRKPSPIGYAPMANIGIQRALEDFNDWIVLQNNDTEICSIDWLDQLIDPNFDAVVPLADTEQSVQNVKELLSYFPMLSGKIGLNEKFDLSLQEQYIPTFFCAAIHSSVFKKIGLVDESFKPGYGEDTEFFLRMRAAGLKIGLALGTTIKHDHGVTFDTLLDPEKKKKVKRLNKLQYVLKNQLSNPNKKIGAVYTCVTGSFEQIHPSEYDLANFDYFLLTDDISKTKAPDSNWTVVDISGFGEIFDGSSDKARKLARFIKLMPHLLFSHYETTVWIDGNISLGRSAYSAISKFICSKDKLLTTKHPLRDCIYDEAECCRELGKDEPENIDRMLEEYRRLGVPKHIGLVDSKFIVRRHNDKEVQALMEHWLSYIKDISKRDQLSFNLVCWLDKFEYKAIPLNDLFNAHALVYYGPHR